jgi:hypothetical protein
MKRAAMLQYGTFLADGLVIFLNVPELRYRIIQNEFAVFCSSIITS